MYSSSRTPKRNKQAEQKDLKSTLTHSLQGRRYGAQDARGACKRLKGLRLHHGPAPIIKNVRLLEGGGGSNPNPPKNNAARFVCKRRPPVPQCSRFCHRHLSLSLFLFLSFSLSHTFYEMMMFSGRYMYTPYRISTAVQQYMHIRPRYILHMY